MKLFPNFTRHHLITHTNQISVGPRLESNCSLYQIRWLLCYYDAIVLKLICLFILLFRLQNANMVTIYWFYLNLKSYKRRAGCGFTR